jgi:di/tricarboxylate transporter
LSCTGFGTTHDLARRIRALAIFAGAIATVALGWLAAPVAFAALLMLAAGVVTVRQAYAAIDWPILILLAAMIPVGLAIESTGLADLISRGTLAAAGIAPPWAILALVLIATMFLSDLVNNAAAAVMMCPVAMGIATGLEAPPDPFLLAVAIGASCAFLTPIGHQSNLLVMGPGGYRFGDYWRLGIVLEALIVLVAVPALLVFWPLSPGL